MKQALNETKAKLIMVANLINKPEQTMGWHVADYLNQIERYIGPNTIDVVLYNNELPKKDLLKKYAQDKELPPKIEPLGFSKVPTKVVGANFIASRPYKQDSHDKAIKRTPIRHDAIEVTKQLKKILLEQTK